MIANNSPGVKKRPPPVAGFKKGQSGNPKGRVKGTPNKMTTSAKQAIAEAAEKLGGPNRLVTWAKEDPLNERAFWATIYPKLLPLQVAGPDGADGLPGAIVISIVDPKR